MDEWVQFDQSIVDAAIDEWRRRKRLRSYTQGIFWAQIVIILNQSVMTTNNTAMNHIDCELPNDPP